MFSSQYQSDDLLYEISEIPHYEDLVQQYLASGEAFIEGSKLAQRMEKDKQLKNLATADKNYGLDVPAANIHDVRKITRKEIEQKRRQQMTKLYAQLRTVLPPESIKGKRAVADHVGEAVNYITYLKKKIKQLSVERDEAKKSNLNAYSTTAATSSDNCSLIKSFSIHSYGTGIEIVIHSDFEDEKSWHLSTVMQIMVEEGLEVVHCISSQTNEGFFHTVQFEVSDPTQVDLPRLQSKLNDLISY